MPRAADAEAREKNEKYAMEDPKYELNRVMITRARCSSELRRMNWFRRTRKSSYYQLPHGIPKSDASSIAFVFLCSNRVVTSRALFYGARQISDLLSTVHAYSRSLWRIVPRFTLNTNSIFKFTK